MYCLITSNRVIPVVTEDGIQMFADWEELSNNADLHAWHKHVFTTLNTTSIPYIAPTSDNIESESVFSATTAVWTPTGPAEIRGIRPGDAVMDSTGNTTRVTGIVQVAGSEVQSAISLGSTAYASAGVWARTSGIWSQPTITMPVCEEKWYSLFTEAGTFRLLEANYLGTAFRDFSDVGVDRISDTYTWVLESLNQNILEH